MKEANAFLMLDIFKLHYKTETNKLEIIPLSLDTW